MINLKKIVRGLSMFLLGAMILPVTYIFAVSLCITYFKLTGQIVEGERIYFDLRAPSWRGLLGSQAVCAAILGLGILIRDKVQKLLGEK